MKEKICSIDGCASKVAARGWCSKHYARWRRFGDPVSGLAEVTDRSGGLWLEEKQKKCVECGDGFSTRWPRQKYCTTCQSVKKSNLQNQMVSARRETKNDALKEIFTKSSEGNAGIIGRFNEPSPIWEITVRVPYSRSASKNRRWHPYAGRFVLDGDVKKYEEVVGLLVKRAVKGRKVNQNKIWVSFFVQKPDHTSDCVNVVDTLCDAIKGAIGVDDRWFSLGLVDWEIKKENPEIFIKIAQEHDWDAQACSHCGGIFPFDQFYKNSYAKNGIARVCRSCKKIVDRHTRLRAKQKREGAA